MVPTPLPRDVLATIVDVGSFREPELCAISLISPHLRYEAQRMLFRDPGPHSINVRFDSKSAVTTRLFLNAVASSPDRLALMVRRFHITVSWFDFHDCFDGEQGQLQHTLFDCLFQALPLMVNLKELRYHESLNGSSRPASGPPPSIWSILKRCPFRLQVFWCSYVGTNNRNSVAVFLDGQSGIRELWLHEAPKAMAPDTILSLQSLFKDACPSLISLGGMPEVVASMLAGRQSLQHMSWDEQASFAYAIEYTETLFDSTNTNSVVFLESLTYGPPLSLVGEVFRNLVILRTWESDIIQKLDMVKQLEHLRMLIVDMERGLCITSQLDNEEQVVQQVFSHLLSLDYLECHLPSGTERDRKYIINRKTQGVTIYTIPRGIDLSNSEGKDALQRKLFVNVDSDHDFVKLFNMGQVVSERI
ncbi:hypothetical protein D9619_011447 [Psilocybe cf. subviscida]|uniref:Uncharacterized protein n=1 Tax=Psilocybe cf. subviscida TaxID=2480587 RepID=A0A8H5F9S0_9AGAR|nr:hypothetical protein D9619_011447 [Psilocybe cf. subviscida]